MPSARQISGCGGIFLFRLTVINSKILLNIKVVNAYVILVNQRKIEIFPPLCGEWEQVQLA